MTFKGLLQLHPFDWNTTRIRIGSGTPLEHEFDISPQDFLRFAKQDLRNGDRRGRINALTNSKRAIDCQIDRVLECLGYNSHINLPPGVTNYIKLHKNRYGIGDSTSKLKLLQALDITPPNLASRVRRIRNTLEHEYREPSEQEVKDGIEIANLFVAAANNALMCFLTEFTMGDGEDMDGPEERFGRCIYIRYDETDKSFEIRFYDSNNTKDELIINKIDQLYLPLIKLNIAIGTQGDIEEALEDLLTAIDSDRPDGKINVEVI